MNALYYGDNLEILQRYIKDESIDLVYLDPPFKSNQDYNVLFAEQDGSRSAAQIKAFGDTWRWDQGSAHAYQDVVENGPQDVSKVMQAFRTFLGDSDLLAYLSMMAPRLVELLRVTKSSGSIYLHCDPTASHYLKMLMDAVCGPEMFCNEVIWKRTSAHVNPKRWGPVHDVLLFYSKSATHVWNTTYQEYLDVKYRHADERGNFRLTDLTGKGTTKGDSGSSWKGYEPGQIGRHWAVPRDEVVALVGKEQAESMSTQEKLDVLDQNGYIYWTPRGKYGGKGFPQFKRYLSGGVPIQDVITDIPPINSQAQERLGYPTQKPETLLQRIIEASSNEGDTVLDPFCGCGTAIAVSERLKRQWTGIDITHLAITLIKHRLFDAFGSSVKYTVIGEPTSLPDAEQLARDDPYQFQWWALGLADARPVEQRKGADKGIDGRLYFHDEPNTTKQIIFSVKAGTLHANYVRDLRGVIEREKAAIGVLLTMEQPTKPMRSEAASAGFYQAPWGKACPRLQILTVADLLSGKTVDFPRENVTFKKAPKAEPPEAQTKPLPF